MRYPYPGGVGVPRLGQPWLLTCTPSFSGSTFEVVKKHERHSGRKDLFSRKRMQIGGGGKEGRGCICMCVRMCVCVRSINLCTDFSLNAWTLSGLRAQWLWKALVKPCPAQGMLRCSFRRAALLGQRLVWKGRDPCPQPAGSPTACFSPSWASALVSLGLV